MWGINPPLPQAAGPTGGFPYNFPYNAALK
jgi:hypothetical protein